MAKLYWLLAQTEWTCLSTWCRRITPGTAYSVQQCPFFSHTKQVVTALSLRFFFTIGAGREFPCHLAPFNLIRLYSRDVRLISCVPCLLWIDRVPGHMHGVHSIYLQEILWARHSHIIIIIQPPPPPVLYPQRNIDTVEGYGLWPPVSALQTTFS